jgi:hypothetical protein
MGISSVIILVRSTVEYNILVWSDHKCLELRCWNRQWLEGWRVRWSKQWLMFRSIGWLNIDWRNMRGYQWDLYYWNFQFRNLTKPTLSSLIRRHHRGMIMYQCLQHEASFWSLKLPSTPYGQSQKQCTFAFQCIQHALIAQLDWVYQPFANSQIVTIRALHCTVYGAVRVFTVL